MTEPDRLKQIEQRALRERTARFQAEKIAEAKLRELNAVKESLERDVVERTNELRTALAELQSSRVASSHEALWQIGEALNTASFDAADEAIHAALAALGRASGASGAAIWEIDTHSLSVVPAAQWRAEASVSKDLGSSLPSLKPGPWLAAMGIAEVGSVLTMEPSEMFEDIPKTIFELRVSAGVIAKNDATLTVAAISYSDDADGTATAIDYLLRGAMILLRQFTRRVSLESQLDKVAQRQAQAHNSMMKSAADLLAATPETFDNLLEGSMRETAELLEVPGIVDWAVDYEKHCYVQTRVWHRKDFSDSGVAKTQEFGGHELLDAAREAARTVQLTPDRPTPAIPSRLAVVRGGAPGQPSFILMVTTLDSGPWNDDKIEALERLSATIIAVENRLATESRTTAALDSSPVSIVHRARKDSRLLHCNKAFLEMLGEPAMEPLVGTLPERVLYSSIADVELEFRESSEWMFEEAAGEWKDLMGDAPSLVIYRGPGGRPILARMRCVEVTTAYDEPFILIHVEDITDQRKAKLKLELLAEHDELTSLMNRRGLRRRIMEMEHESGTGALVLIDLDRFKYVNDSLGHETGNRLLREVAARLSEHIRPGDAVGRLGGDEFAIAFQGPLDEGEAQRLVQILIEKVGSAVELGPHRVYPSLSAGIAFWGSADEADLAFIHADTAMYKAKDAGGRRLAVFDSSLQAEIDSRQRLESELRRAIDHGELEVHYQPEVSLLTGKIIGAEALIRWQHPERGLLTATLFMEEAEEMGLATDVGSFVLAEACAEAAGWPGGPEAPLVRINLAASQICDDTSIYARVNDVLRETGLDNGRLCLEVTESAMIRDLTLAEQVLAELSQLGLHLALDDFGTGYSSLSYLKRLKVDSLKIDKSFVSDLTTDRDSVKFINSILSLARALNLDVVAEGVETEAQAQTLRGLGCERAQGYFFYRAMPAMEIRRLLEAQHGLGVTPVHALIAGS